MNKNLIVLVIVAVIITPSIALASWWNPISWFDSWAFIFKAREEKTEVLEKRIKELETQWVKTDGQEESFEVVEEEVGDVKVEVIKKKEVPKVLPITKQKSIVQEKTNLLPIQEDKSILEKEQKEALVKAKQDELRETEKANKLVDENNKLVAEYKDLVRSIDMEILNKQKVYLDDYRSVENNSQGKFLTHDALNRELSSMTQNHKYVVQDLELEKSTLYYEYQEKIEDLGI